MGRNQSLKLWFPSESAPNTLVVLFSPKALDIKDFRLASDCVRSNTNYQQWGARIEPR